MNLALSVHGDQFDSKPHGLPIVTNGLPLCKIHHAAYAQNILGIRPDYGVEIHTRLPHEIEGPMLRHGLQEHDGRQLMQRAASYGVLPGLDETCACRLPRRGNNFIADHARLDDPPDR
jgi:hypothetical protein